MTIGRLAKAAGVNVETIRYYQRRGLIEEPRRPPGGQRRYSPKILERIRFIRRAQQLGFSLEEAKALLAFAATRNFREVRDLAERKRERLELWLGQLQQMVGSLRELLDQGRQARGKSSPILAWLSGSDQPPRL